MIGDWSGFDRDALFSSEIFEGDINSSVDYENVFNDGPLHSSSSTSSLSCIRSINCQEMPAKKKRRRDRVLVLPLPRIVKSDMRRSIGTMVQNVYNSADFDYMTAFMQIFHHASNVFTVQIQGTEN